MQDTNPDKEWEGVRTIWLASPEGKAWLAQQIQRGRPTPMHGPAWLRKAYLQVKRAERKSEAAAWQARRIGYLERTSGRPTLVSDAPDEVELNRLIAQKDSEATSQFAVASRAKRHEKTELHQQALRLASAVQAAREIMASGAPLADRAARITALFESI